MRHERHAGVLKYVEHLALVLDAHPIKEVIVPLIERSRSIVVACDVDLSRLRDLVEATASIPEVGAYKVGAGLALGAGLPAVVQVIRDFTDKPIIYDHQKAGSDIPDTASFFMKVVKGSGVDSVIIFPQAGPATQSAWTAAAHVENLDLIVGAAMTHSGYLASDGGFIRDDAIDEVYSEAAAHRVGSFVVPATQPDIVRRVRTLVNRAGHQSVFYIPGFITQGGRMSDVAKAAGPSWHAIVGRAIYDAPNIHESTKELAKALG